MNEHTVSVIYFGCFILAVLIGILHVSIKHQTHKMRDEQREMIKWQVELEKRANEIREKRR
jgi:ATP/ADP translocase